MIASQRIQVDLRLSILHEVLPCLNPIWRMKTKQLAAKDRNLHPVAILNSTARTTRWTGTASEKKAQFLRAKFEK